MDKETLSNYGWIVICVLVLAVMIALAGPFGTFVAGAVKSTTKGLFDVNKNALNAAGVPGLTVQDQEFSVPDMNNGTNNEESPVVVPGATFTDGTTLTWEELEAQGYMTGRTHMNMYEFSAYQNTELENMTEMVLPEGISSIGMNAFENCHSLQHVSIPKSVQMIESGAFHSCTSLTSITFRGTIAEWNDIDFVDNWNINSVITEVICSDGTVSLS